MMKVLILFLFTFQNIFALDYKIVKYGEAKNDFLLFVPQEIWILIYSMSDKSVSGALVSLDKKSRDLFLKNTAKLKITKTKNIFFIKFWLENVLNNLKNYKNVKDLDLSDIGYLIKNEIHDEEKEKELNQILKNRFSNLTSLNISQCVFLTHEVGLIGLSKLSKLTLIDTFIDRSLSKKLGSLSNLTFLNISNSSRFVITLLDDYTFLSCLTNLTELRLKNRVFVATIKKILNNLASTKLKVLDLRGKIIPSHLDAITKLNNLEIIYLPDLSESPLLKKTVQNICKLTMLKELYLDNLNILDEESFKMITCELTKLKKLKANPYNF